MYNEPEYLKVLNYLLTGATPFLEIFKSVSKVSKGY